MVGNVVAGKLAGMLLVGTLATGSLVGAANAPADTPLGGVRDGAQNVASEVAKVAKGQGEKISSLARSVPGGPGKGRQISAVAQQHGRAVSAAAKARAKQRAAKGAANGHGRGKGSGGSKVEGQADAGR